MGLGDLGELGNIGGIIGSVLAISISAIVLLTFAPGIVGDIDGIALNGTARATVSGEQFLWVVAKGSYENADEAWRAVNEGSASVTKITKAKCDFTPGDSAGTEAYYTPKGNTLLGGDLSAAKKGFNTQCEWKKANKSITALSGGSIALLLFSAAAILIPAGAIGFLGYFGARFVAENIGGGPLAIAIGATVIVVIAGAVLPQIFDPLDTLYLALDGKRFWVYSQGLGKLGSIIGNFLGISLLGGIVTLGMLLWKGQRGTGSMAQAM